MAYANDSTDVIALQEMLWVCTYHKHKGKQKPENIELTVEEWEDVSYKLFEAINDTVETRVKNRKKFVQENEAVQEAKEAK